MFDSLRRLLLTWLRIPPEPHPPQGSPGSLLVFRAGKNFYRWRLIVWAWNHAVGLALAAASFILLNLAMRKAPAWLRPWWTAAELAAFALLLAGLLLSFLAIRLSYELRWYMVTDRSLRIRHGIWSVHELTMTFANIQEIRVSSGPLQNALGLADVVVHAAGGATTTTAHGHKTGGHQAAFEGVENANQIRDLIIERLRIYRDSGLGEATPSATPGDALTAAQAVLAECRALRQTLG